MDTEVKNIADNYDLPAKIIVSVRKAVRKLVETAAANNESLVIGEKDGSFRSVPAKELLEKMSK